MNAWAVSEWTALCAVFCAIACERARSYGATTFPLRLSAIVSGPLGMTVFVLASVRGMVTPSATLVLACATASAISDLQTGYIFDRMLAAAIPLLIAAAFVADRVAGACLGACATGGLLLLPFVVSRGRALGFADVKLGALIGFGLGPAGGLAALWCAAVSGGIVAVCLLLLKRAARRSTLPFAPFLAIGASWAVLAQ